MTKHWVIVGTLVLLTSAVAAQSDAQETRPATSTWLGDTGFWFVPTGEVLPGRRWSVGGYRINFDFDQGFSDVTHVPFGAAVGLADRAEVFGSFQAMTRIDRDIRPLFLSRTTPEQAGGVINDYPLVRQGWTGTDIGDLYIGAKLNVLSEHRQEPLALAFRTAVKVPTGDDDGGVATGKADWLIDGVLSKELAQSVEVSGFGGVIVRGDPDGFDLSNGLRWGIGAGFPSRGQLRITAELYGETGFDEAVPVTGRFVAVDGSVAPPLSDQNSPAYASIGLTYQATNGFFIGGALNYSMRVNDRSQHLSTFDENTGDSLDAIFRIGFHPGVRVYVPPPPPPPPAPPPPPPPANRPPTVDAQCDPCSVQVGQQSTVTADAKDPDGDPLTYTWRAPSGTLANPSAPKTLWTAPNQPGSVPITVTVNDGRGGTASDTVTIQVTAPPPPRSYMFEDVHFDFDRYTLRPAATRVLDELVKAMREDANLQITIEGHTCNIGTAEYNLALGDRRANSVRDYLTSQGISAGRLQTLSYGEERPRHDNAREETRRLNRRAALTVRLQGGGQ